MNATEKKLYKLYHAGKMKDFFSFYQTGLRRFDMTDKLVREIDNDDTKITKKKKIMRSYITTDNVMHHQIKNVLQFLELKK